MEQTCFDWIAGHKAVTCFRVPYVWIAGMVDVACSIHRFRIEWPEHGTVEIDAERVFEKNLSLLRRQTFRLLQTHSGPAGLSSPSGKRDVIPKNFADCKIALCENPLLATLCFSYLYIIVYVNLGL